MPGCGAAFTAGPAGGMLGDYTDTYLSSIHCTLHIAVSGEGDKHPSFTTHILAR